MLELRPVPAVLDTGGLVQPAVCRPRARISWAAPPGFRGAPGSCKRLLVSIAVLSMTHHRLTTQSSLQAGMELVD